MKERIREILDKGDFGMAIPMYDTNGVNVVDAIFDSHFKSQIETGTGKGYVNIRARKKASRELFGTSLKASAKEYEKYGFLMDKDMIAQAESGIADQYWSYGNGVHVRFKKDKVTATFTFGDSLAGAYRPSLTTDPHVSSLSRLKIEKLTTKRTPDFSGSTIKTTRQAANSYIELQYHGDLTIDCIESVLIPQDVLTHIKRKCPELLKKIIAVR